jgi:hypothetical protein
VTGSVSPGKGHFFVGAMQENSTLVAGTPSAWTTTVRLTLLEVALSGGCVLPTTCAVPSTGSFIRIALNESPSSPTGAVYRGFPSAKRSSPSSGMDSQGAA